MCPFGVPDIQPSAVHLTVSFWADFEVYGVGRPAGTADRLFASVVLERCPASKMEAGLYSLVGLVDLGSRGKRFFVFAYSWVLILLLCRKGFKVICKLKQKSLKYFQIKWNELTTSLLNHYSRQNKWKRQNRQKNIGMLKQKSTKYNF